MVSPTPTQSNSQAALRAALIAVLPTNTQVIAGQVNRVPEPSQADYVLMTAIMRKRIETNDIVYADCSFTGSTLASTLTVTAVEFGTIVVNAPLFGVNVAPGTIITGFLTGEGGVGTYTISIPQTVASSKMAAGQVIYTQPQKVTWQLDFHSAVPGDAADMVTAVSTLFRSTLANTLFNSEETGVWPLYADDPKQLPFINAESQYETRWILDCVCQVNEVIAWPQQFADQLSFTIYPAN